MMHATAGRSRAMPIPQSALTSESTPEIEGGSDVVASLSRIPVDAPIRRKCAACDKDEKHGMDVSPKLDVGDVDHPAEREADAIADRVMAGGAAAPASEGAGPASIRAKANPGGANGAGTMRTSATQSGSVSALGSGEAMSASDRSFFEPRLGQDLSHVRMHRGPAAEIAAQSIGARAFTIGSNIAFGKGEYGTDHAARHLMAHELAHVQQNSLRGDGGTVRMKCSSPVDACSDEQIENRKAKIDAKSLGYSEWEYRKTTSGCYDPAGMAAAIKQTKSDLFLGNVSNYKADIVKFNDIKIKKAKNKNEKDRLIIGVNECFAFPVGWVDPKIGDVDDELKSLNKTGNEAEKNKIIAAIYGEQSAENETEIAAAEKAWADHEAKYDAETDDDKKLILLREFQTLHTNLQIAKRYDIQRKYILYAMLLRIEGFDADWGPDFVGVAKPGTFHSLQTTSSTHKNNYLPAVEHLEGKTPKKTVNAKAIDRLKDVVTNAKKSDIPSDAGPYYFHWWSNSTAEKKYQALLKEKVPKDEAERKAAYHHAKTKLGAPLSGITETEGWLKKITGPNHGQANERIGSMYIFR